MLPVKRARPAQVRFDVAALPAKKGLYGASSHRETAGAGAGAGRGRADDEEGMGADTRFEDLEGAGASDDSGDEMGGAGGRARRSSTGDSDEEEDEEVAALRSRKIMVVQGEAELEDEFEGGQAMEPFNLRAERDEGHFDASGEYVRRGRDPAEEADAWLDGLDTLHPVVRRTLQEEAKRGRARGGAGGGGDALMSGEGEEDAGEGGSEGEDEGEGLGGPARARLLETCVRMLRTGETVAAGLRRLSGVRFGTQGKRAGGGEQPSRDKASFDALTEAADGLVSRAGLTELYGLDKRALSLELADALADSGLEPEAQATVLRAANAGERAPPQAAPLLPPFPSPSPQAALPALPTGRTWEYRWSDAAGSEVFGPFPSEGLNAWAAAGFFAARVPELRQLGCAHFLAWARCS